MASSDKCHTRDAPQRMRLTAPERLSAFPFHQVVIPSLLPSVSTTPWRRREGGRGEVGTLSVCLIDPSISGGQSFHAHRSVIGTDSQGAPLPLTHLLCSPHAPQVSVGPPCCLAFTGPNYCPGRCCSRRLFPCLRPSSDQIGRSSSAHIRHGTARCSPSLVQVSIRRVTKGVEEREVTWERLLCLSVSVPGPSIGILPLNLHDHLVLLL